MGDEKKGILGWFWKGFFPTPESDWRGRNDNGDGGVGVGDGGGGGGGGSVGISGGVRRGV